ncbi:forkhead box protein K1-like [Macrobrachium nipponense]|uniref:forkhead box protein K1-like n=1 Tax=Macrobrachium nipponense TaxID=159736 RepID=UPI0030C85528
MDLYLPSTEPGLTLQEMIDCDIKCGIDFNEGMDAMITSSDLNSLDLSGMSSLEAELDLKSFEPLFDPLEKLEDMDTVDDHTADELNAVNSWMNMSSMSNYNIDLENGIMVNPSAVLPTTLPSTVVKEEVITSSATTSTLTKPTLLIKTEPQQSVTTTVQSPQSQPSNGATVTTQVTVMRPQTTIGQAIKQQSPLVSSQPVSQTAALTTVAAKPTLTTASQLVVQASQKPSVQMSLSSSTPNTPTTPVITARTTTSHNIINNRYKTTGKPRKDLRPEEKVFPKPAYSYSCLIALALKNSTTGSLPVSEIYSFMCEHFPYFRTAPNGWKNSVRHNLSLNKCFEKIEKPVVAGSNQRKGCLWALNPAKAHKMDDEVQKWSKKDLQGIKDAMQYPEVLDALEGGEMKFEYSNCGVSSCSEDEDEDEEVDPLSVDASSSSTVGSVKVNSLTSTVVPNQRVQTSVNHVRHTVQNVRTSLPSNLTHTTQSQANIRPAFTTQSIKRSQVTSSDETELILPDSTMTEINLQTNGSVVDDLGNEIKVEEEPSSITSSSPRGLVVRKLPGITPLRSATVRANYVYTPTISSPHQQHHTLNRLVLTNGKLS